MRAACLVIMGLLVGCPADDGGGTGETGSTGAMTETSGTMTETSGTMPGTSTTMPGTSEAMESSSSESGEPLGEFDTRIQPIFEANCSCHLTTVGSGGLSLREGLAYDNLVGVMSAGAPSLTRVVPGSTQDSYLVHKLRGTHLDFGGVGMQMPLGATLPEADIAEIEAWIDEGAPE